MRLMAICGLALMLAGCAKIPDSYAPPIQRVAAADWARTRLKNYISMDSPDAMDYVVDGVVPALQGGTWRWTLQKPTFQFMLPTTEGIKLRVDLTVAGITFQQTGPVNISFFINDRLLEKVRYDSEGEKNFLKPVPPEWLYTQRSVVVRMEIDKMWVSPDDGIQRGFIISRIGFVQ